MCPSVAVTTSPLDEPSERGAAGSLDERGLAREHAPRGLTMNIPVDAGVIMPDVQSSPDTRQLAIDRVGVRGLRHPMMVATVDGPQPTVAQWELTVALP